MKRVVGLVLCLVMCVALFSSNEITVRAADNSKFIGEEVDLSLYKDYENPETGEYFRWKNGISTNEAGDCIKTFSFKIQYSVTSSRFKVASSSVKISANAHIEDRYGYIYPISDNKGHKYEVDLSGNRLFFAIDETESGDITGLSKNKYYKVTIINSDAVSDGNYLVGEGSVIEQ